MPKFVIKATHNIDRPQIGLHINKGQEFTININMMGITPNNLFGNSRCQDALIQQFRVNGIDVPRSDYGIYSRGTWDITMIR